MRLGKEIQQHMLSLKGGLVIGALLMLYGGLSDVLDDTGKPAVSSLRWGQVCDDSVCNPAALLAGDLPGNEALITAELKKRPDVKTLCLGAFEGSSRFGLNLSQWVSDHGYNTCIPGGKPERVVCANACTLIFAGGKQRQADKDVVFSIRGDSVPWLIRKPPNALTGEAGIPAGSNAWQQALSIKVNRLIFLSAYTLRFGSRTEQVAMLLSEAASVPGHLSRTLSPSELTRWKLTSGPPGKNLAWLPEPKPVATK